MFGSARSASRSEDESWAESNELKSRVKLRRWRLLPLLSPQPPLSLPQLPPPLPQPPPLAPPPLAPQPSPL